MPRLTPLFLTCGLILSGCAQNPVPAPQSGQAAVPQAGSQPRQVDAGEEARLPAVELTDDLLFQFLVSEIAGQRGLLGLAKDGYLDLARKTRDPRIVRRGAEIALYSHDQEAALELGRLWLELEPDSPRAMQTLIVVLISQGRLDEVMPHLEKILSGPGVGAIFMQMPALFAKTRDTAAAYQLVNRLAQNHPDLAEASYALAHAASQAGYAGAALEALKRADQLRPGWEAAALLRAQLLAKSSHDAALAFLKDFVEQYPGAHDVRLTYARMLVSANQVNEAHRQFAQLAEALPGNAEVMLAAGLLSVQVRQFDAAENYLGRVLELGQEDDGVVRYYLGQIAEQRGDFELARSRYLSIAGGEYLVSSRTRLASLLARQGRLDEARALLKTIVPADDAQKVQIIQAEADLLREARDHAAVFALLDAAVKDRPENSDLLYDRAMAAEKLNRLDVLESDLRKVIKLKPDYAHAYNALGYTLVEKTDRLKEATELLDKAMLLAPDDPFILDSVGWLHYRKGDLDRAREYLERAWNLRQDPEIAAHLGEVLWMKGSRDEASRLWQSALQNHPGNEVLIDVLNKFKR